MQEKSIRSDFLCAEEYTLRAYGDKMTFTKAAYPGSRYTQNPNYKKANQGCIQETRRTRKLNWQHTIASYQFILYLDSTILKDAYSSSS